MKIKISVILPAYNEELSIAPTLVHISEFLPSAYIYIINNNCSDNTVSVATKQMQNLPNKYKILTETRKGKANAIRKAFLEIDSDIYIICDSDNTYSFKRIAEMISIVLMGDADMVVGDRLSNGTYKKKNTRLFHNFGNVMFSNSMNYLFHTDLKDLLSGLRVFSRRFVKTYPIIVSGFELETELTVHAIRTRLNIIEIPIEYNDRVSGSFSKLSTFNDGFKIIKCIFNLLRLNYPFKFYVSLSLILLFLAMILGTIVIHEYIITGLVLRMPSAVLTVGLLICGFVSFAIGQILDYHNNKFNEYLQHRLSDFTNKT